MRWIIATLVAIAIFGGGGQVRALESSPAVAVSPHKTAEHDRVDLVLPTDNDTLFSGGGPAFYQYIERTYKGVKSTPWEGGQYGFVRDPRNLYVIDVNLALGVVGVELIVALLNGDARTEADNVR